MSAKNKFRMILVLWTALFFTFFTTNILADPSTPAVTTNVSTSSDVSITLHGFIDTSGFWQNQDFSFGNGQDAEFPVPNATGNNHDLSGASIQNTRLWLDIKGPALSSDWSVSGHIESDFFGGFNGTGAYSGQQETPRLRQAFMTMSNADSGSKLIIGQQWDLLFPGESVPESLTHIAFPLGFATGMIGWRFPGVVYEQDLNTPSADSLAWRLDMGAFTGSWNGPGSTTDSDTAANANFRPQVEVRLRAAEGDWLGFIVGHYSTVDLSGVGGTAPTPITDTLTSSAVEVGTTWQPGPFMLKAAVYEGKALGQVFGAMAQFGDISETGGYVQGGYKFTHNWAGYITYATDHPNQGDVVTWTGNGASGRIRNQQYTADLIYTNGPYGFGFEWLHAILDSATGTIDGITTATNSTNGNQFSASAIYHF
ncbi:MAG: hypothetical protein ACRETA_03005 [Gammaproteobacteria bacterium]